MLVLAEVALRLVDLGHPYYSAPELYQPSDDPRVLFEPRPNFDGFSEGVTVHTNSRGLRERELPLAKPAGTRRVVFVGDSVTFGAGVQTSSGAGRARELPGARRAGPRRVVFVGDSVTFGAGVRDDEPYARLLEAAVNGSGAGPIETVNTGVVGYNTIQELARLEQ